MENTRVLPPLVRPPATSDRCCELAEGFLGSIEHQLLLCHRLSITDEEIEDYVAVSAIALCWYLASFEDAIKRDELIEELSNDTFTIVVGVEAAGIARERGCTLDLALHVLGEQRRVRLMETPTKGKRAGTGKRSKAPSASLQEEKKSMRRRLRGRSTNPVRSGDRKQRLAEIGTRCWKPCNGNCPGRAGASTSSAIGNAALYVETPLPAPHTCTQENPSGSDARANSDEGFRRRHRRACSCMSLSNVLVSRNALRGSGGRLSARAPLGRRGSKVGGCHDGSFHRGAKGYYGPGSNQANTP